MFSLIDLSPRRTKPLAQETPRSQSMCRLLSAVLVVSAMACAPADGDEAKFGLVADGNPRIPADGQTTLSIALTAESDGTPDNSPVTLSVSSGVFGGEGVSVEADGTVASLTPQDGAATFTYRCDEGITGAFFIRAESETRTGGILVQCSALSLRLTLSPDLSACSNLQADGTSSCPVVLQLSGDGAAAEEGTAGIPIRVAVNSALTNFNEEGDPRALSEQQGGTLSDNLEIETDDNGTTSFFVFSTRRDLVQTLRIGVTIPQQGSTSQSEEFSVVILPFEDNSSITLRSEPTVIGTGQTTTLRVSATTLDGTPASQAEVTISVPPGSGASLGAPPNASDSVTLVLDASGSGSVVFNAPSVDEETVVQVSARYVPGSVVSALEVTETITVFPEDALMLEGFAAPQQIRSDTNETARLTATLRRFRNGVFEPVVDVPVTFRVRPGDSARVMIGTRPDPLPSGFAPTLTATVSTLRAVDEDSGEEVGRASILVSAQNERVRGRTIIEVSTEEEGVLYETEIELDVERDPVPQSLIFLSAAPENIHVRGSAFAAASVLSFQVLDDTNEPLPDVFVRFDLNRTADPSATVLGGDFTGPDGTVSTVVSAGTQAGPLSVIATATFEDRSLTAESLPLVVQGGLPTFTESYIYCDNGELAQIPPFSATCSAVLVDRFTNRAPQNLTVHFRAEGGNVNPMSATDADGNAPLNFATGGLGPSTTSLLSASYDSWSYAAILPFEANQIATESPRFDAAARNACFDGSSRTECDLVGMCRVGDNEPYCPLGLDFAVPEDNCWEHLNAFALTGDAADIGPELLRAIASLRGGDPSNANDLTAARTFLETQFDTSLITGFNYFVDDIENTVSNHDYVRAIVDTYLQSQFRCGFQTSCLVGQRNGLDFINHDSCPLGSGCMDFSTATLCPHDGLLTLTAYFRGEESFIDVNGNGQFDFFDENNSGQHEYQETAIEPYIDLPEPYLDRNDNCVYDDLSNSERLQPVERIRHSDIFSDSDGSGDFGFRDPAGPDEPRNFTNSHWDRDTMVFLSRHLLALGEEIFLEYGQPCPGTQIGEQVTCDLADRFEAAGHLRTALCEEAGRGYGLASGCIDPLMLETDPVILGPDDSFNFSYRWRDANGNCASPGFAAEATASAEGSIEAIGETEVELDKAHCGFQGSGALNVNRPWCVEQRTLGSQLIHMKVASNCANGTGNGEDAADQGHLGELKLEVEGAHAEFGFRVFCPICGNGALEEGESCDDGNTEPNDGCDARCNIE